LNLLLFTASDRVAPDRIALHGRRLQHLLHVHRATVGDTLRVGELGGSIGTGEIVQIDATGAVLGIALDQPPPAKLPLRLVLALPRPKVLRRVLRSVAEIGVAELHLINSFRVEKSYWQTPVLEDDTIRDCLVQGLEQSRDTSLPVVHCHRRFKPFVEDVLPGIVVGHHALLAHPGEHPPCPRDVAGKVLLVIGPEGGFIPYEVQLLQAAGCATVSLGARILRVENALGSAVGRLF
jgi:RsmE family RNA methyltransferase